MNNAVSNEMMVQFRLYDILMESPDNVYDLIVSNPPYVSREEMTTLAENVRSHEPSIALTPGDGDALRFYERLAALGKSLLKSPGYLYVELNEFHASEIEKLFRDAGYTTEMRKDLQGKWRMLKATYLV
jgi:release factor glutamine methyltransferase